MGAHPHLDEKRLFALLEGDGVPRKAAAHLDACDLCRERLGRLRALREAAALASTPSRFDWSGTDEVVREEIRAMCSSPRDDRSTWLPFGLAVASAAAVVLALAVDTPAPRQDVKIEGGLTRLNEPHVPPRKPSASARRDEARTSLIGARKKDAVPESLLEERGGPLVSGDRLATGEGQSARIALAGGTARVELAERTALSALSLRVEDPQLFLERGAADFAIPLESQIISMRVLAGGTDFLIDEAEVTFRVRNGGLEVFVREGDIMALDKEEPVILAPGRYVKETASKPGDEQWADLSTVYRTPAPPSNDLPSVQERRVAEPRRGDLPLSAVRETMAKLKPALRRCYENALKRDSNLILAPRARLEVDRGGRVAEVSVEGVSEHPTMARCLEKIFTGARFRPPRGGPVRVVIPLKLYPRR